MSDIAAKLHPIELNFIDRVVRALLRGTHCFSQRGYAQHPPATRHQLLFIERRACVKSDAVFIVIG